MNGELPVNEACDQLGVGPTQFANLRAAALLSFLDGLQPKPVGRPRRMPPAVQAELDALRRRVAELEHDNRRLRTQLELVPVALPQLAVRSKSVGEARSRTATPPTTAAASGAP